MSSDLSLRVVAENLEPSIAYGLNTFVDQFAVAMKRSTSPNTGSEREPQPIETAPRDGRFLILEEDASGKFNIARWAPEAGGWVRENDEPIKIIPSCWYPLKGQNDLQPKLDISTRPSQPERPAAPQRQLATDIIASRSDAASPETMAAVKTDPMAVEPKRASRARNRFAAFSIVASLVVAACAGMHFRAEVTSYMARHTVRGDLFGISTVSGEVVGQVTQWLSRNFESQVSAAQISQRKNTRAVDASSLHLAVLEHQAQAKEVGAQISATTAAKAATLLEPAGLTVERSPELAAERDRGAALVSQLAMTRRDVETKAALLSKAAEDAAQLRQTAEATAAELRQSLSQEHDRVAALARELATARRDLETEVSLSRKVGEEAEQLRQSAKATTAELEQERNRSAALARDPEPAQRVTGARPTTEHPAVRQIDPINEVAEHAASDPPRTAVKDNPEAARLMARASALVAQGNIAAARLVLERAAETGSPEASFALAETYDPLVLSKWGTYGTRGEAMKARELYRKGQAGGIQEANDRINALRQ
jgi:hypothetical protein